MQFANCAVLVAVLFTNVIENLRIVLLPWLGLFLICSYILSKMSLAFL